MLVKILENIVGNLEIFVFKQFSFSPYLKLLLVSPPFNTITNSIVTFGKKIPIGKENSI